jgi:hypothetical protein
LDKYGAAVVVRARHAVPVLDFANPITERRNERGKSMQLRRASGSVYE